MGPYGYMSVSLTLALNRVYRRSVNRALLSYSPVQAVTSTKPDELWVHIALLCAWGIKGAAFFHLSIGCMWYWGLCTWTVTTASPYASVSYRDISFLSVHTAWKREWFGNAALYRAPYGVSRSMHGAYGWWIPLCPPYRMVLMITGWWNCLLCCTTNELPRDNS